MTSKPRTRGSRKLLTSYSLNRCRCPRVWRSFRCAVLWRLGRQQRQGLHLRHRPALAGRPRGLCAGPARQRAHSCECGFAEVRRMPAQGCGRGAGQVAAVHGWGGVSMPFRCQSTTFGQPASCGVASLPALMSMPVHPPAGPAWVNQEVFCSSPHPPTTHSYARQTPSRPLQRRALRPHLPSGALPGHQLCGVCRLCTPGGGRRPRPAARPEHHTGGQAQPPSPAQPPAVSGAYGARPRVVRGCGPGAAADLPVCWPYRTVPAGGAS